MDRKVLRLIVTLAALAIGGFATFSKSRAPTPAPYESQVAISPQTLPLSSHEVVTLKNLGYVVGYSETMRDPLWVEYTLNRAEESGERQTRPREGFLPDGRTRAGVTSQDYVNSGYDRGHMAPSYAIGKFHGRQAQIETFVMSNVVPQTHACNDGVWNSIERMEADDFVGRFGTLEVVDGPIFGPNPQRFASGVSIPTAFYKAIRRPDGNVIAFIVPQMPQSPRPEDYLSSLNQIKVETGIDVFANASESEKAVRRTKIW